MHVIVAEGLVAHPLKLVITVPGAHVVGDLAEVRNLIVFEQRIPAPVENANVRRVVNQVVRDMHADRHMMSATTASGESGVHTCGIDPLDLREMVDVIVDCAMACGNAWCRFFIAAAQPDAACAEPVKIATQHLVATAPGKHHAIAVHVADRAARR